MRRWTVVLVMALIVAACGGDGAAETTTSTTATTTSTSTTSTTTTTTLVPDLTEADTVTTVGLGPVRIGMTVEQAEAVAGRAMTADGSGECFFIAPEGLAGVGFMVTDGAIARVDITAGPISTRSGARIGLTEQEIEDLFPGQIEVEPHKYVEGGHYLIFVPRDAADAEYRVVFETDGSVVTQYRAGILPEVEWVEGCA